MANSLKVPPHWPLSVLFLGMPVAWVLGVWQFLFFAMAVPMGIYLMKLRSIEMPRAFSLWLIWLAWILTGLFVIQVDAPGAVPGSSFGRYIPFAFRFGWYLSATIVALYVINSRRAVTSERIARILAWFFVMLIAGGVLGLYFPNVNLPSVLQLLLPGSISSNSFVHDLVHLRLAQVHTFTGEPEPRPSAPFAFTNEWGLVTACTLPFFIAAWSARAKRWRVAMVLVLGVAVFVIVSSLNRGTWLALVAMALFVFVRSIVFGQMKLVLAAIGLAFATVGLLVVTPLGELISLRLANPHSDEGRTNLGTAAVQSTIEGSPIVGFGTTRDVDGNFSSIAGGASAACAQCQPPPLGTHGQLWLVIFGAGFVGLFLYVSFMISQVLLNLKVTSRYAMAALCTLIPLVVTMPIYNVAGVGIYMGFVAMGILGREEKRKLKSLQDVMRSIRRRVPVLTVAATMGAGLGLGTHIAVGSQVEASQRLLVPTGDSTAVAGARPLSLDSEALVAMSQPVLAQVAESLDFTERSVRESLSIGAEANTRVLVIGFRAEDEGLARQGLQAAVKAYLAERQGMLMAASQELQERYGARQDDLSAIYRDTVSAASAAPGSALWDTIEQVRRDSAAVEDVMLGAGQVSAGHTISSPMIRATRDALTVRVASGLAVGGLVGLPLSWFIDRRFRRIGSRSERSLGLGTPVLARVSPGRQSVLPVVLGYLPVAGVLADPNIERARRLAMSLNEQLGNGSYLGARAVLVVDTQTRVSRVRDQQHQFIRMGVQLVGLIVCEGRGRREE